MSVLTTKLRSDLLYELQDCSLFELYLILAYVNTKHLPVIGKPLASVFKFLRECFDGAEIFFDTLYVG